MQEAVKPFWMIRRLAPLVFVLCLSASAPTGAFASAQEPVFVPGLYETESRNSAFPNQGATRKTCLASVDFEAFRRDTIAQYSSLPQFKNVCRLSETRPLIDGFAFAMDCGAAQTIISFHISRNLVQSTTETKIVARPEYSSTILTLSRRVGVCSGRKPESGTGL